MAGGRSPVKVGVEVRVQVHVEERGWNEEEEWDDS